MTNNCRKWLEKQGNEFMQPFAEYLTSEECCEFTGDDSACPGWYSRLSAPGYLDCTEWQGPYATEDEALEGLYETYGDD